MVYVFFPLQCCLLLIRISWLVSLIWIFSFSLKIPDSHTKCNYFSLLNENCLNWLNLFWWKRKRFCFVWKVYDGFLPDIFACKFAGKTDDNKNAIFFIGCIFIVRRARTFKCIWYAWLCTATALWIMRFFAQFWMYSIFCLCKSQDFIVVWMYKKKTPIHSNSHDLFCTKNIQFSLPLPFTHNIYSKCLWRHDLLLIYFSMYTFSSLIDIYTTRYTVRISMRIRLVHLGIHVSLFVWQRQRFGYVIVDCHIHYLTIIHKCVDCLHRLCIEY